AIPAANEFAEVDVADLGAVEPAHAGRDGTRNEGARHSGAMLRPIQKGVDGWASLHCSPRAISIPRLSIRTKPSATRRGSGRDCGTSPESICRKTPTAGC